MRELAEWFRKKEEAAGVLSTASEACRHDGGGEVGVTATYQSREELVGSGLPSSFSVKIKPRPEGRGEVLGETIKLNSAANHIPAKGKFGIFFVSPWGSNSTSAIWRRLQPDLPGRSEAIRRILRAVLKMTIAMPVTATVYLTGNPRR